MIDKSIVLSVLAGLVLGSIILFSASIIYSALTVKQGALTEAYTQFNKEYGAGETIQPLSRSTLEYSRYSVLLVYMNVSSTKFQSIQFKPNSIVISYADGRRLVYSRGVFLSDEFKLSSNENTLVAALIVEEGVISGIEVQGEYTGLNLKPELIHRESFQLSMELEVESGSTYKVVLSINI
ncbi:MAG TPA: hypothetical protein ENF47_06790 [Thermoprotei archaeon]|nr:hypothetical protein [Thermoprotei archaeon]